ncbi:hypothetical protein OAT18_03905, partial [Tenacibaculum sp.]|nr:hypothetical protein [Tenacibaculum sp.]
DFAFITKKQQKYLELNIQLIKTLGVKLPNCNETCLFELTMFNRLIRVFLKKKEFRLIERFIETVPCVLGSYL